MMTQADPPRTAQPCTDDIEAVRRSAFLRNICADLSRRADPSHRTDEEMEVLDKAMTMLEALDKRASTAPAYAVNRASILELVALIAGNAINANLNIEDGIKPADPAPSAAGSLSARFESQQQSHGAPARMPGRSVDAMLDRALVAKAEQLLRRAFSNAWDSLFETASVEVAASLMLAVQSGLNSLLWSHRADASRQGRHFAPLSPADLSWRASITDELLGQLRRTQSPLHRSIVTKLIAACAYSSGKLPREAAETVVRTAYSAEALAQLTDWQTFRFTLDSFNNIFLSLVPDDDENRKTADSQALAIEAQGRLVRHGADLLRQILDQDRLPPEQVRGAGSALANAVTVFADQFGDETLGPVLQASWHAAAAVLSPNIERFRINHHLLHFLALPDTYDFAEPGSDIVGMDFAAVPARLQPLFDAGQVSGYDLRHHYRNQLGWQFYRYVMSGTATETQIRGFIDGMERHVGDAFRAEALAVIHSSGVFQLAARRALTLFSWCGADGRAPIPLDHGKTAEAVYGFWTRLSYDGKAGLVREALERFWDRGQGPDLDQVRARTLALRGYALLVSYCGCGADADGSVDQRLSALRKRQPIDYLSQVVMSSAEQQVWKDHDNAVIEATLALASIDIMAGGDPDHWLAEEGWSMDSAAVRELDGRLAQALQQRIERSRDPEAALADLDRIRRLSLRNPWALLPALKAVVDILPPDHPARAALSAELLAAQQQMATTPGHAPAASLNAALPYDADAGLLSEDQKHRLGQRASAASSWHLPPLFASEWVTLDEDQLLAAVARTLSAIPHDQPIARADLLDAVAARQTTTPFYQDHRLVEILIDDDKAPRSMTMLFGPDAALWLNGTSPGIHHLNATVPINLAKGILADPYLHFFTSYVQGDEGPFFVVTNRSELDRHLQPGVTLSPEEEQLIATRIRQADEYNQHTVDGSPTDSTIRTDEQGRYLFMTLVVYARQLFAAKFAIRPTGETEMLEDEALVDAPKMRLERIVGGWRLGEASRTGLAEG